MNIEAELERLHKERDRIDTVIGYLETQRNGARPRRQPSGTLTAGQAAEQALQAAGAPMRTPDLLKAVQAAGARMKDTDGLYKTLSRSARFKKAGRGLWELA